jgi:hypothetical protein
MKGSEMKSRWTKITIAICALTALAAVAAGSASASEWVVNKAPLSGSTALSETVTVVEPIAFKVPNLGMEFKCHKARAWKSEIVAKSGIKVSLIYNGCETTVPATGCNIEEEMWGWPIEGALSKGAGTEDSVVFTGEGTSKRLWQMAWPEGPGCGFGNWAPNYRGKVTLSLPTGQTEATEQTFSFLGEKESPRGFTLEGSDPSTVSGKIKLKLKSGLAWAYR